MKDNSNAEKLFEALGELDEAVLQEALITRDKEALKAVRNKESTKIVFLHPTFKKIIAACVCVMIVVLSVFTADKFNLLNFELIENNGLENNQSDASDMQDNSNNDNILNGSNGNNSFSSENTTSVPDTSIENNSSGNNVPGYTEPTGDFSISSIDMLNFYSAKKAISDNSLLPISNNMKPHIINLSNNKITYYEIDRHTQFTISMVTYFTINLNDENGFLAQKLGGTGLVEVVITENNLDNMITFKKDDKYFSCLLNGSSHNLDSTNSLADARFSTHKYIEGFNIVKNIQQENYKFTVYFKDSKVTGIDCERFKSDSCTHQAVPDDITLIEDYCVVMFVKRSFTIDQLEVYFNNEGIDAVIL